jgi:xanthine dehydrogenase accessory factor
MQDAAVQVRNWLGEPRRVAVGRVVGIQGFSTWPGDELLAVDSHGVTAGAILGTPGTDQLRDVAVEFLRSGERRRTVTVEIHGKAVIEAGLSCGGQASVLLQRAETVPAALWDALAERRPVALVTEATGRWW